MTNVFKVLITGGAGYIGSVLTKELLCKGFEVTVLDKFMYGQNSLLDCCYHENFSIIRGDIRDRETVSKAMKGADFIIHLAALVGAPLCNSDPTAATTTNSDATKLLLSVRSPGQKLLFPCTNSGYGIGEKNKFCTEETPLRPISLYGRTKVEAEKAISESGDSISFRLATVFGVSPRMRTDLLVNNFVYKAVNDRYLMIFEGHFKRNYIHIGDVA
ncbi:MAG: NAD-dependent epimerase/dehydratase, partial [Candidatus Nitrosopolaris sp.]